MLQSQALKVMLDGHSVFLTGPAGSGKSFILNKFIREARRKGKLVAVTASTGIAATHIGGTTIHSWSGLGIRDYLSERDVVWLENNDRLMKRYNSTDILIIDEVSMLHGARLNMVNQACKLLRRSSEPFGGLQVILTGDLFQLPPVSRGGGPEDFVHISNAWQELDPKICYLSEQHRQESDDLIMILSAMRANDLQQDHYELLQQRIGVMPEEDVVVTRLYSHNIDVESINQKQLDALPDKSHYYEMSTGGRAQYLEQLTKSVLAPEILELKLGAEVMFVANNFSEGYANGSRGKVVAFDWDTPIVQLHASKKEVAVEQHSWTREEDGRERAHVTQLPLRLAWAITIHKSQGMSLDAALIDLSRSFTYGMGYVALSRVRSMSGLYLHGLNQHALLLHPDIHEFDRYLRQSSSQLADKVGEIVEKVVDPFADEDTKADVNLDGIIDTDLYEALKLWRTKKAEDIGMPAYIVANNNLLEAIARRKPQTEQQLLATPGVGKKKLDTYGGDIISIVQQYIAQTPRQSGVV